MDTQPPPGQHPLDVFIGEAADLALWLVDQLRGFLAPQPGKVFTLPFLREMYRDYLVPAEAALRREIHLIAACLPPLRLLPRRLPRLPRAIPPLTPRVRRAPRPPVFRLTERQPRPPSDDLPESRRPRIRLLTPGAPSTPPPAPKPARATPAAFEARLRRRFAALEAASAAPAREARRLQRLRARLAAPRPLLSFVKIPGYRARPLDVLGRSVLDRITAELFNLSAPRPNTS